MIHDPRTLKYYDKHTLESKNLLVWVHNGRVGSDWSSEDIIGIGKVNDDDLVLFVDFLSYTDEVV